MKLLVSEVVTDTLNFVYVLTNSAMPGLVKIGKTSQSEPETRVSQLYSTGVPVPFDIEFACRVQNHDEVETALHRAFAPQRVNLRREFFRIEPEQAIAVLKLLHVEDATAALRADTADIDPQEKEAAGRLRKRRPNQNFEEMGIPIGAQLTNSHNEEIAIVVSDRRVSFRENPSISMTAATRLLLGNDYDIASGRYWFFAGRALSEIYEETYPYKDE